MRRIAVALLQVLGVAVLVFALGASLPGDTAVVILGKHGTPEQMAELRERLDLDEPLPTRFLEWFGGLAHGDLGTSLLTGKPVIEEIADGLATTVVLTSVALGFTLPLALALGVLTGLRRGSPLDRAVNSIVVVLDSVPEFALGLLLVGLFSLQLGWLPATAAGISGFSLLAYPAVLVLPVMVLVCKQLCALARQIRIGVAEADTAEYTSHARMHGLPERIVLFRHVLPNAAGTAVQQLARTVDGLLGGVVVVEALFALPGLGSGFVDAVMTRDLPTVQGYTLIFAITTVTVNLLADIAARQLVPQREVTP
ncbi:MULTISPECIES: ABC transporter permease [unclassified Actinopolyspora]|uniref:ABC transporter permease n=1 Tax=unclassified Actinopolyspora TaxID=2639451 RepID=UPI0013F5F2E6|nr:MULTISPECIES: ABC transporter permease [unclassified Actinopolyspora]NHD18715.1 ABC transporter permease [Actinopolyspora sp. BKK2]NHE77963.1 ABC transporter permease [Actinopolyspora sp. BKK1]